MLVAEWSRLTRTYAERNGIAIPPGQVEAALVWREPMRSTAIARIAAERVMVGGGPLDCLWTGKLLTMARLDIDHCLPWTAWPCSDLWNLGPYDRRVNQHEKRDKLPSAARFAESRDRIIGWWDWAYLSDDGLAAKFYREVAASLPVSASDVDDIYSALNWRRLRLLQDQGVTEWR